MSYKNKSPAKKLRSLKRIFTFIKTKSFSSLSISPTKPNLSITISPSFDLPPRIQTKPKLSLTCVQTTSISPRAIYHPAIISACKAFHGKHPSQLTPEEANKFNFYRTYKQQHGEPIEDDIVYLPSGGMKNCLQCGELT